MSKAELTPREFWIWLVSPRKRLKAVPGLQILSYRKGWAELSEDERKTVTNVFNEFCAE